MRSRPSQVPRDLCVRATSIFEGVGQDGEVVRGSRVAGGEGAFVVSSLS